MSYVHADDRYSELTAFRERLSDEVGAQLGYEFLIFQDHTDIEWGQQWRQRIEASLNAVNFLIPIVTPRFFASKPCREELERFLLREEALTRQDLVLPVYYIDHQPMNDPSGATTDKLIEVIASRQYADWRDLRFEPFTSPLVRKRLEKLASQIRVALSRLQDGSSTRTTEVQPASMGSGNRTTGSRAEQRSPEIGRLASSEEQPTRGSASMTAPPIRVVDPYNRGDHQTISDAIRGASPGDRIVVRPGLYMEGLVIDKPLEILGDGPVDEVVVQAKGKHAVLFKTTMGRLANLKLRQIGGGDWFGVEVSQGRLELERCDISSQGYACVAIHGNSDPRLRSNRIHGGKQGGVMVYDNAEGVLEDNEIFGNGLSGVEIKSGGNPTLRGNRIYEGKTAGVFVNNNGQGVLEDNEIFGNAGAGVAIASGGNPTLRRNRIHDGGSGGVFVYENGEGVVEDNEIFGNGFAGVEIKSGGNPTLRGNHIHDGKTAGVFVYENGEGVVEDNEIFGNVGAGVRIQEDGNPMVRRNRIYDGKDAGVFVQDNGHGVLEDNEIFGNAIAGVAIRSGGNPTLRRNRIHDGKSAGVYVYENGEGMVEDNEIFGNLGAGVEITGGGNSTIRRNVIKANTYEALWIHKDGGGTIEDNDLRGNARGPWDVEPECEPKVTRAGNLE